MPEIPYKPVPSVAPVERKTPELSLAFPRAEFTQSIGSALESLGHSKTVLGSQVTQVGAALASLGGSFEKAGNEIWNRASALKRVENETAAIDADVKFMISSANMSEGYMGKTGTAASGGLEAHNKSLEDLRQKIMSSLPNDEARKIFNERSLPTLGRSIFAAARHAYAQNKAAAAGSYKAQFEAEESSLTNQTATGQLTEEQFEQKTIEAKDRYAKVAPDLFGEQKGAQLDLALKQLESKYRLAYINGISKGDVNHAMELLNKWQEEDRVMGAPAMQARNTLNGRRVEVAVRVEGGNAIDRAKKEAEANPDAPTKSLEAITKDAIDNMPRDIMENKELGPIARSMVEQKVKGDWLTWRAAREDGFHQDVEFLSKLIYDKSGVIRKNLDELKAADPVAESRWDHLPEKGQWSRETIRKSFETALYRSEHFDPMLSLDTFTKMRGMIVDNKEGFLDMNFLDPKLTMNMSERRALMKLQDTLKADPDGNSHLKRAWDWISHAKGEQLSDLGILRVPKDDPNLLAAQGHLIAAMDAWVETHKGAKPDYNDIVNDIAPRLLRHASWSIMHPLTPGELPIYEKSIDQKWADDKQAELKRAGLPPADDAELMAAYRRKVWLDIYSGRKVSPKPPEKKPAAPAPAEGRPE